MEKIKLDEIDDYNPTNIKLMQEMHEQSFIDVTKPLKRPPIAISIGEFITGQKRYDAEFGTFGNFSCIVGSSKAKKTFLKSLIVASFIGGNSTNYAPTFKSHRKKDMFILDFDTEQGGWHAQRVFKRSMKLAGANYEFYKPFYLRRYDYKERLQFIEWCILESEYRDNIGLINIDGYADLVRDVNDLEGANDLVQKLMRWTDISKAHITGILHKNFGGEKPTGHVGSAILKKAETICMMDLNDEDKRYTDVKFSYTRGFPIEPFKLFINNDGLPVVDQI